VPVNLGYAEQMRLNPLFFSALVATTLGLANEAAAQPVTDIGVPPGQPQPGQPPPQYQQPQYYQPQPQYQQQPAGRPAKPKKWQDGDPVPAGYHVEDRPRSGLVIGGTIMVLVPYTIGAFAAVAAKFDNETTYLLVPVVGPWLTMGARSYSGCGRDKKEDVSGSLGCVGDIFVVMGLIVDGVLQATGATLLLVGALNTKPQLVRDEARVNIRPMTIGSGYGLGAIATF
jgi:hypothetical protein